MSESDDPMDPIRDAYRRGREESAAEIRLLKMRLLIALQFAPADVEVGELREAVKAHAAEQAELEALRAKMAELEAERLAISEALDPVDDRQAYMRAWEALRAAHKACFDHPDRDVLGMSHGPFSGTNVALGIIAGLSAEKVRQRCRADDAEAEREARDAAVAAERERCINAMWGWRDASFARRKQPANRRRALLHNLEAAIRAEPGDA